TAGWAALLGAGCGRVAGSRELGARSWVWPRGLRCQELAGCGRVGCVARSRVRPR
ncbi:hypothetical protein BT67DRAFT_442334, partial [Trichocladium antarcticum]